MAYIRKLSDIPCVRFVRQVSNGAARSKYGYIGMEQDNAAALETATWKEAKCDLKKVSCAVGQITRTDQEVDAETGEIVKPSTYSAWLDETLDVYKQGGDAIKEQATFCGYAGCVAYRFNHARVASTMPQTVNLRFNRDKFLRSGLRVVLALNDNEKPYDSWDVIRGESSEYATRTFKVSTTTAAAEGTVGCSAYGFLGQPDNEILLASRAAEGVLECSCDCTHEEDPTRWDFWNADTGKYIWVYVTIEDYADYWQWYSTKEERSYYIEGSAVMSLSSEFDYASTPPDLPVLTERQLTSKAYPPNPPRVQGSSLTDELGNCGIFACTSILTLPKHSNGICQNMSPSELVRALQEAPRALVNKSPVSSLYSSPEQIGGADFIQTIGTLRGVNLNPEASFGGEFVRNQGVFALARYYSYTESTTATQSYGYFEKGTDGESVYLRQMGPATLMLGYASYLVTSGLADGAPCEYKNLRIVAPADLKIYKMNLKLNVWRIRDMDAVGNYPSLAIAACASELPFFLENGGETINAEVVGDGTLTQDVEMVVGAQRLCCFDIGAVATNGTISANTSMTIPLGDETLKPGDVLVFAPVVTALKDHAVSVPTSTDGYTKISWFGGDYSDDWTVPGKFSPCSGNFNSITGFVPNVFVS